MSVFVHKSTYLNLVTQNASTFTRIIKYLTRFLGFYGEKNDNIFVNDVRNIIRN